MGFIVSFLIGFGILRILNGKQAFRAIDLFLAWGLGVGLSSQMTFFSILIGHQHKSLVLFLLSLIALMAIWVFLSKKKYKFSLEPSCVPFILLLLLVLPLLITQIYFSINQPYGDWDAWSLWNYRANSLFRSTDDWLPVYHNSIQGKHPWLVPHYIVWGWTFLGKESTWIPAVTALLMSFATIGLLVYALASSIGRMPALLAGIYLISIPFFNSHAASQYASIFVAFFLLGCIIAAQEYLKEPSIKYAAVFASFLAFLANSKDEGLLLALLILVFLSYKIFKKQNHSHQRTFIFAFLGLMIMFVVTEFFMRSSMGIPFVENKYYETDLWLILDIKRWKILVFYLWHNILLHPVMGGVFFLLCLLGLAKIDKSPSLPKSFNLENNVLKIISMFFLIFFVLYITATTDLHWRLSVTVHRLFFIFLPTFVYLIFGFIYKNEK